MDKQLKQSGIHTWLVLWKASRAVELLALRSIEKTGLGLSDFAVLEVLLHKGEQPINRLGKKVLLTSGSMTAAVDRLAQGELVIRKADPNDRRCQVVALTKKGEVLIKRAFTAHAEDMEQIMVPLKEPERDLLIKLVRKLGLHAALLAGNKDGF